MWLDNAWTYRKKVTITGQTGAGSDYQVKLAIGQTTGGDFNLGGDSLDFPAAENDGGDFRFTEDDGETLLSFWVESVVSGVATVWVKVSADLGTDQDIYIYYANSSATNASDGFATFVLFDNFEDGTIDSTKWDITGVAVETAGQAKIGHTSNGGGSLASKGSWGANHKLRTKIYLADTNLSYHSIGFTTPIGGVRNNASLYIHWENDPILDYQVDNGAATWYNTGINADTNGYGYGGVPFLCEIQRLSSGNTKLWMDDVLKVTATARPSTELARIHSGVYDANRYTYWNWIFIAKFADVEPTFSAADAREDNAAPDTRVSIFLDDFIGANGAQPDTSKWTQYLTNGMLLDGSSQVYQALNTGFIHTDGKFSFTPTAEGFILETQFGDFSGGKDVFAALYDEDGDTIQIGITTYQSQGMYSYGTGKYSMSQAGNGNTDSTLRWYRLEVVGTSFVYSYSADRVSWTVASSRTLASTIDGHTFRLRIGGGGSPYNGGTFGLVEILAVPVVSSIKSNFLMFSI